MLKAITLVYILIKVINWAKLKIHKKFCKEKQKKKLRSIL